MRLTFQNIFLNVQAILFRSLSGRGFQDIHSKRSCWCLHVRRRTAGFFTLSVFTSLPFVVLQYEAVTCVRFPAHAIKMAIRRYVLEIFRVPNTRPVNCLKIVCNTRIEPNIISVVKAVFRVPLDLPFEPIHSDRITIGLVFGRDLVIDKRI